LAFRDLNQHGMRELHRGPHPAAPTGTHNRLGGVSGLILVATEITSSGKEIS
jgi:hypothetical protein